MKPTSNRIATKIAQPAAVKKYRSYVISRKGRVLDVDKITDAVLAELRVWLEKNIHRFIIRE